jgi:hypothetical protein
MAPSSCLHVSGIPETKNGTNGKQQLLFVCCKWKTEVTNFRLFAANTFLLKVGDIKKSV